MTTLEHFYEAGGMAETRVYGTITESLRAWHEQLPSAIADKIKLLGYLQNSLLSSTTSNLIFSIFLLPPVYFCLVYNYYKIRYNYIEVGL